MLFLGGSRRRSPPRDDIGGSRGGNKNRAERVNLTSLTCCWGRKQGGISPQGHSQIPKLCCQHKILRD